MFIECWFPGATRRYWWAFALLASAYVPVAVVAMTWIDRVQTPWLRTLAALSPLPFVLGLADVEFARIRRTDELRQRMELEAAAAAMVVSLLLVLVLGLLDNAGIVKLPLLFVAPVMCAVYVGAQIWSHRHYR